MKPIPEHDPGFGNPTRDPRCKSIALIVTLSVMSLLLMLVLAFATVTQVEIQTAHASRDNVASKYLAQAAFNRAMASITVNYAGNTNLINRGWLGTVSVISSSWLTSSVTSSTYKPYVTDIETVYINALTGLPVARAGADGYIDFVVLPNSLTNYYPGLTPQWIGMRATNGDLVGRIAFFVTGGGLCINSIGNTNGHSSYAGFRMNTRNEGQSPSEINLAAALTAMGWSAANATNDAVQILRYRYGADLKPGQGGVNDNSSGYGVDLIDNDGDGLIDEAFEDIDEPYEALANSDATNAATSITGVSDDLVITDLKQLYQSASFPAAMRGRFQTGFSSVVRFFTTQAPVPLNPQMINLNSSEFTNLNTYGGVTNGDGGTNFFRVLTNKFAQMGAFGGNWTQQVVAACNIVSYKRGEFGYNEPFRYMDWPFNSSNPICGAGVHPYINEITYMFVTEIERARPDVSTDVIRARIKAATNFVELWYPYTNAFDSHNNDGCQPEHGPRVDIYFDTSGAGSTNGFTTRHENAGPGYVLDVATWHTGFNVAVATNQVVSSSRFFVSSQNLCQNYNGVRWWSPGNDTIIDTNAWTSAAATNGFNTDIVCYNFRTEANVNTGYASPLMDPGPYNRRFDYWPSEGFLGLNTNILVIPHTAIVARAPAQPAVGATNYTSMTNYYSFQLIDPRCKWSQDQWVATAGHTLGATNSCMYSTASTADDRLYWAGIGPKTFYHPLNGVWKSAAELGRVHRGTPWQTINFIGDDPATVNDRFLLDEFTTYPPLTSTGATNYLHGRINLNMRPEDLPVWAALFTGMPLWDGTYVDYTTSGIVTNLSKTRTLASIASAPIYYSWSDIPNTNYSNVRAQNGTFPQQLTDEQREWFIEHMYNMVATQGAGNFFTIWAWGQALKGPTNDFSKKTVSAETLIIAMVQPTLVSGKTNMQVLYFRYNPDLNFYDAAY